MHQMGLSQSHASINKKRIVDLSWGFGHSQGCGVGEVVIFSHHKGVTAYADSPEQIQMLDSYLENPKDEEMLSIYDNYIDVGSYDDNMKNFGYVSLGAPSSISIYADTFEDKDSISDCIDKYNKDVKDDKDKITYTDYVALLMSSTGLTALV